MKSAQVVVLISLLRDLQLQCYPVNLLLVRAEGRKKIGEKAARPPRSTNFIESSPFE